MRAAADHPELLRHVVIEDMDCRARGSEMSETFDYDAMRAFEPTGVSSAAVAEALAAASPSAFDADRVRGYVERGRVLAAPGGRAVSLVQPLGFALAHDRVLASRDGSDSMRRLAEVEPARRPGIHLWRADPKTSENADEHSCAAEKGEGGVEWIVAVGERSGNVHDAVFVGAGHSVHNTRQEAFVDAINALAFRDAPAPSRA